MKTKLKLCLFIFLCFSTFHGRAQRPEIDLVKSFLATVIDKDAPPKRIVSNFLCRPTKSNSQSDSMIIIQLMSFREQLKTFKLDDFEITKYTDLPNAEQTILAGQEENNIYVVKRNNKRVLNILVRGNKIASFVTFNKGNLSTLMILC